MTWIPRDISGRVIYPNSLLFVRDREKSCAMMVRFLSGLGNLWDVSAETVTYKALGFIRNWPFIKPSEPLDFACMSALDH